VGGFVYFVESAHLKSKPFNKIYNTLYHFTREITCWLILLLDYSFDSRTCTLCVYDVVPGVPG